ncbi:MAG: Verru_Chthon cassette protein C [Prosthecobacter sp.]|uniref:Verru_Chthon cassette protein C n=1 Tax=Prosthecobacter sp. TaxID=1965333 RepID=UPI003902FF01
MMQPRTSRPGLRAAFSLVEILVAMAITSLLLVLMAQMLSSTQLVWKNTRSSVGSFREARNAFETISRRVSQATLNAYWGYNDPAAPTFYQRQSELHFVSGPAQVLLPLQPLSPGHALFFQAPLGIAESADVQRLEDTLNTIGYWVAFGSDLDQRPAWLREDTVTHPERRRFRLMEFRPPTEQLDLYRMVDDPAATGKKKPWIEVQTTKGTLYQWFNNFLIAHSHPIADHIFAIFIEPLNPVPVLPASGTAPPPSASLAPDYHYDSRRHQWAVDARANVSRHQMPPRLQLTLLALDEDTWLPLTQEQATQHAEALTKLMQEKIFQGLKGAPTEEKLREQTKADLQLLDTELRKIGLRSRTFTAVVNIRAAKWITSQEAAP